MKSRWLCVAAVFELHILPWSNLSEINPFILGKSTIEVRTSALHIHQEVYFSCLVFKDGRDDHQTGQIDSWIFPSFAESGSRRGAGTIMWPLHQPNSHDAGHHGSQSVLLQCQTDDREGSPRAGAMKRLLRSGLLDLQSESKVGARWPRAAHYIPFVSETGFPAITKPREAILGLLLGVLSL